MGKGKIGKLRSVWEEWFLFTNIREAILNFEHQCLCNDAGAQCAHAALGITQQYRSKLEASFKHWERHGQAKIALKIQDDDEMVNIWTLSGDYLYLHIGAVIIIKNDWDERLEP
jgi:hypothetical protein